MPSDRIRVPVLPASYRLPPPDLDLMEYRREVFLFGPAITLSDKEAAKERARHHRELLRVGKSHYYGGKLYE